MNKKIICKSTGNAGANFSVKLPKTLIIPPNSEIGLIGGSISTNAAVNIDSTNDTFLVQFGSHTGEVGGTEDTLTQLAPFFVKLRHGTYITTTVEEAEASQGLYWTELKRAFQEHNPYSIFTFQFEMTGANGLGGWVTVCDYDIAVIPSLKQSLYNLANITIANNVDKCEISDIAGGFIYESVERMVVPAVNQKTGKGPSISCELPQANYNRFFLGYALEKQITYTDNEPYNIDKSYVGLFKTVGGQVLSGADPTTAALYENRLPVSVEIVNGTYQIKILGVGEDGFPDPENVTLTDTGVDPNAQNTLIKVNIEFVMNGTLNQINLHLQLDNNDTAANLSNDTVIFPAHWLGNNFKFVCCQDSGAAQTSTIQLLTEDRLDRTDAGSICKLDDVSGAGGGNANVTLIFNEIPNDFILDDAIPYFTASDQLSNLSRQCNHNFLMSGKNYSFIQGNATESAPHALTFNNNNSSAESLTHIQILNLPIDTFVCDPHGADIQNIIHSFIIETSDSSDNLEPHNIIYCKLKNKQELTVSNLDFRIVDSSGKIQSATINTTQLILHLKERNMISNQLMTKLTENQNSLMDYFDMVKNKLS